MRGILYAQVKQLIRRPVTVLLMTLFMILFALLLGGDRGPSSIFVPVYSEMNDGETEEILALLNEAESQYFEETTEASLIKSVREGDADVGLILNDNQLEYVIAAESPNVHLVQQNVEAVYRDFLQKKALASSENADIILRELEESMFTVEAKSFLGENSWIYDPQLQTVFGFAVFFVIYTIAYNVMNLLLAKQSGIWDRFILSPAKKWEMYLGILLYAFILGYIQVVIVFSIFHYVLDIDFYDGFGKTLIILIPYVLSIVSLSVFLAGISKNVQTFDVLVPLISVSFAMIGGAYWPIEIVSNKILLTLSEFVPIYHIMEAFKAVTIYGEGLSATLFPVSILLLMSVVFMGLGLNLMERRQQ